MIHENRYSRTTRNIIQRYSRLSLSLSDQGFDLRIIWRKEIPRSVSFLVL